MAKETQYFKQEPALPIDIIIFYHPLKSDISRRLSEFHLIEILLAAFAISSTESVIIVNQTVELMPKAASSYLHHITHKFTSINF